MRYLIVVARFNEMITRNLLLGAEETLQTAGVARQDYDVLWVPGSFELPAVAARAARKKTYDAVICLGAVIRGETSHYDFVAGEAASGLMRVSIETGKPIIFGVLTTNTVEQAMNRAGLKSGNKGRDAASAALEMTGVIRKLEELTER